MPPPTGSLRRAAHSEAGLPTPPWLGPGSEVSGSLRRLWALQGSPRQNTGRGARQTQLHRVFSVQLEKRCLTGSEGPGACVGWGHLFLQRYQPSPGWT